MLTKVISERVVRFHKSIEDIVKVLEETEELTLYVKPSAEEWSGMQIVSHVLEAVDFWLTDLEGLLIVPGTRWGRNHEHVRRLAAVDEGVVANLKKDEVIAKLKQLAQRFEKTLSKVSVEDLEKTAPSYNVNFDGKPLSFIIDQLIIQHVEGHYGQLVRHLQKVV
ncbi:DinB family protein [Ureibacillus manganicus]|uniref:Damage-inducible protein DinB n=1 Tax=Ureibacillus manganicus DSM 26584 TaxID=1384049 RepID=A0A0A3I9U3_9BACL|nr:DinB family protein [Ureibacillus manganicus]KGR80240.1 damage-inducible protein DinB [Ureibacillus manganicus DSM 26584]